MHTKKFLKYLSTLQSYPVGISKDIFGQLYKHLMAQDLSKSQRRTASDIHAKLVDELEDF